MGRSDHPANADVSVPHTAYSSSPEPAFGSAMNFSENLSEIGLLSTAAIIPLKTRQYLANFSEYYVSSWFTATSGLGSGIEAVFDVLRYLLDRPRREQKRHTLDPSPTIYHHKPPILGLADHKLVSWHL